MDETDDSLLSRWFADHDREALGELVKRYGSMVFATCRRILGDTADAEDAAQDCFEILAKSSRLKGPFIGAWLHQVAVNRAKTLRRAELRRKRRESLYDVPHPVDGAAWTEIVPHIDAAIAQLPDRFRVSIVAHFYQGHTHESAAKMLGVSRQTVTYRIAVGAEKLKRILRKRGVVVPAATLAALMRSNLSEAAPAHVLEHLVQTLAKSAPQLAAAGGAGIVASLAAVKIAAVICTVAIAVGGLIVLVRSDPQRVSTEGENPEETQTQAGGQRGESPSTLQSSYAPPASGEVPLSPPVVGSIQVRVYDSDTREAVKCAVMVKLLAGKYPSGAFTDDRGVCVIPTLPPGPYEVWLQDAEGYSIQPDARRPVTVVAGQTETIEFACPHGKTVSGRVVDMSGEPVGGAVLHCRHSVGMYWDTRADEQGQFVLHGFEPGEEVAVGAMSATGTPPNIVSGRSYVQKLIVPAEGIQGLELELIPMGNLTGVATYEDGAPASKESIEAVIDEWLIRPPESAELSPLGSGIVDDSGKFAISGLYPGTYLVGTRDQGVQQRVEVKPGETTAGVQVACVAKPEPEKGNLTISGRVFDKSGKPIGRGMVSSDGIHSETDKDGNYTLSGLFPGPRWLMAAAPDHLDDVKEAVEAGSKNVNFYLQPSGTGVIAGRVVRADSGAPITDFEVRIQPKEPETNDAMFWRPHWDGPGAVMRDEEGRFEITSLDVGDCRLYVRAAGFSPAAMDVSVKETAADLQIRMPAEARLEGAVVTPAGDPVAYALIAGFPAFAAFGLSYGVQDAVLARTDEDGKFSIGSLPGATRVFGVAHSSFPRTRFDATLRNGQTTTVKVTMNAGAVIKGKVTLGGNPVRSEIVLTGKQVSYEKKVDDGLYEFEQVPAGSMDIKAFIKSGDKLVNATERGAIRRIKVANNDNLTIDFDFPPADVVMEGKLSINGSTPDWVMMVATIQTYGGDEEQFNAEWDELGAYRIQAAPGQGRLYVAAHSGFEKRKALLDLELTPGQTMPLDFNFTGGAVLSGRVAPVKQDQSYLVFVIPADDEFTLDQGRGSASWQTVPDPGGSFRIEGIIPGDYVAYALAFNGPVYEQSAPFSRSDSVPVSLSTDQETGITFNLK